MITVEDAKAVAKQVRQLQEDKSAKTQADKRVDEQWTLIVEYIQELEGVKQGDQMVVEAEYRKHYPPLTAQAASDIDLAFKYAGVVGGFDQKPSVREEPLRAAAKGRRKVGKARVKRMVKVESLLQEGKGRSARKKAEEEVLQALRMLGRTVWEYRDILSWARVGMLYKRYVKDWHREHKVEQKEDPRAAEGEGTNGGK